MKPAIAIPRVSTKGQDEENQVPDIERFASDTGHHIIHTEYIHGVSAFHGRHLKQVHAVVDQFAGVAAAVIFWKLDRSTRQGLEGAVDLRRRIRQAGMTMLFATQPYLNGNDAASELMFANLAVMAQEESITKSDRIKIKQQALRISGSFVGKPMLGLDITILMDRNGRAFKTLLPSPAACIIARIFMDVAGGISPGAVARMLNDEGSLTRQGGPFQEKAVLDTVRNTAYRGVVSYAGVPYMHVMPLVSPMTWQAANAAIKARSDAGKGHGGGRPLMSLLRPLCGRCGAHMNVTARDKPYAAYRCFGLPGRKGCGNTILQAELDAEVTAEFEAADDVYIRTTVAPGTDHSNEIAAVTLAIRDLDVGADDYLDRHGVLITELKRLKALPVEAPRIVNEPVFDGHGGKMTEGDWFKSRDFKQRQAFIQEWRLTVWPKGRDPRWALTRG